MSKNKVFILIDILEMNWLHELSNIYDLQLLCSTDAVECHLDVKLARYLVVGSFAT